MRREILLQAHRQNKLTPYSKIWWESLYNLYFYDYVTTKNSLSAEMIEFCNKKLKAKDE